MKTSQVLRLLQAYESRNVTYVAGDGSWPIVWKRASGSHVWDAENRRYLDLTAAFGVAAAGHANPRVVRAGQQQLAILPHAMGDVHPHELKARLARELSRLTFERWTQPRGHGKGESGKTVFGSSGFEAVEAALKTARLATGRRGILAFEGAYHGLGYGALNATHRAHFRAPFRDQLARFGRFIRFPERDERDAPPAARDSAADRQALAEMDEALERLPRKETVGAILVEPMQARGGIRIPPHGFLQRLRAFADRHGALLILDEIYTGFGRTGRWFACEHDGVVPDIICLGKALTGGFPLSACVGKASVMDHAWPPATGEAIHTSTFLGHPVGCAMALAQLAEIRRLRLPQRAARLGATLAREIPHVFETRAGLIAKRRVEGLLGGIELSRADGTPAGPEALETVQRLLRQGFIVLPEGPTGEVIGLTPPLIIPPGEWLRGISALRTALDAS